MAELFLEGNVEKEAVSRQLSRPSLMLEFRSTTVV
jgi:hypothetical protein